MSGLKRFYDELISIFASSIETESGFRLLVKWYGEASSKASNDPSVESSLPVLLGKGDPQLPSSSYQYEKTWEDLIQDSSEGGRNVRVQRNGIISLTYALWEDEYRATIKVDPIIKTARGLN